MGATTTIGITCTHDCPDACRALVTVEDGRATDIRADSRHPVTGRHLCVKVDRYLERVYSPHRLTRPLRRTGPKGSGEYTSIPWDEALDEVVGRWQEIIARRGPESILGYSYLGSMGVLDAFGTTQALFNRMGATRLGRSICGPQWFALSGITQWPWSDPENLADANLVVVWGMDPVSTSIHTWDLIRAARKRNDAPMVVVDPYRSRTAARADLHLRPHPGTDGALALAVGHVLLRDGLADAAYLDARTQNMERYREAVEPWTPGRASEETGIPVADIETFAHLYATRRPAAIRLGVGMQRAYGSGSAIRAIQCLPALAGQWAWAAGGISQAVSLGALNLGALTRPDLCPAGTREVNMIQLGRALTDPSLDPPIESLFVWNSNPAIIAADQQRVLAGLRRDDLFTVVHDQFLTDTARHADIVLPATTMMEHADLVGSWGFSYLSWNEAAIAPIGESRSNAELTRNLAERLGYTEEIFRMDDHSLMELALANAPAPADAQTLRREGFVRVGPDIGTAAADELTFDFSCDALQRAGLHPVAEYRPPRTAAPANGSGSLRLLTLKRHHSINSSYGTLPVLLGAEPHATVEVHPEDADARAIAQGDTVRVSNELGSVVGTAVLTDRTLKGTIAVPFGRWLDGTAATANTLTSDELGDLAGGPTFCDTLVHLAPA